MTPVDFSNLERKSKTINQRSDELTAALSKIEEKLNSLNLGIELFLEDSGSLAESYEVDSQCDRIAIVTVLGYGKHGDKWGLLVKRTEWREWLDPREQLGPAQEMDSDVYPLLAAPRTLRMKALDQIAALVSALDREADKLDEAVARANEIASKL